MAFGLYAHGNFVGIVNTSESLKEVCKFLNQWAKHHFPKDFKWTSLAVNVQLASDVHSDCHNAKNTDNVSVSVGSFSGGELWLALDDLQGFHDEDVRWRVKNGVRWPGRLINTHCTPVRFNPHCKHATMPWKRLESRVDSLHL